MGAYDIGKEVSTLIIFTYKQQKQIHHLMLLEWDTEDEILRKYS